MADLSEGELEDSSRSRDAAAAKKHKYSKQIHKKPVKKKRVSYKEELNKANQEIKHLTEDIENLQKSFNQLKKDHRKLEKELSRYEDQHRSHSSKDEAFRPDDDVTKRLLDVMSSSSLPWKGGASEASRKSSQCRESSFPFGKDGGGGGRRLRRIRADDIVSRPPMTCREEMRTSQTNHRGGRGHHRGRSHDNNNHSRRGKVAARRQHNSGRSHSQGGHSSSRERSRERSQERIRLQKLPPTTTLVSTSHRRSGPPPPPEKMKIRKSQNRVGEKKVEFVNDDGWKDCTEAVLQPDLTDVKKIPLKRKADSSTDLPSAGDTQKDAKISKKEVPEEEVPEEAKLAEKILANWMKPLTSHPTFPTEDVGMKIGNRNPLNLGDQDPVSVEAPTTISAETQLTQIERRLSERISNQNDPVLDVSKSGMGKTNPLNLGGATPNHPISPMKAPRKLLVKSTQPPTTTMRKLVLKSSVSNYRLLAIDREFDDPRNPHKPRPLVVELKRCLYTHDAQLSQERVTPAYKVEKITATPEEPENTPQYYPPPQHTTTDQPQHITDQPQHITDQPTSAARVDHDDERLTDEETATPQARPTSVLTSVLMYYRNPALQSLLQISFEMLKEMEATGDEEESENRKKKLNPIDESPRSLWVSTTEDGDESQREADKISALCEDARDGRKEDTTAAGGGDGMAPLLNISAANSENSFMNISLTSSMNSWLINEESLRKFLSTTGHPILSPIKNPKLKEKSGSKTTLPRGKKLFQSPKKS